MADYEAMIRQISNENTAKTLEFNRVEAEKARTYQTEMSNTSHQREVADLKAAGLNPVLSANGGAQSYSASSASGSADNSAVGAIANYITTKINADNAKKIADQNAKVLMANKATDLKIAQLNAQAQRYASDNAYAASKYATDHTKTGALIELANGILGGSNGSTASKIGASAAFLAKKALRSNYFKRATLANKPAYQRKKVPIPFARTK